MSLVQALQAALANEHAVIYGYGYVGARLPDSRHQLSGTPDRTACLQRLQDHKRLRDQLAQLVTVAGGKPVAAMPAYQLPSSPTASLGRLLEAGTAAAMWGVVEASGARTTARRLGIVQMGVAARWMARWSDAFPSSQRPALPGQPSASQPSTTPTSSPS